MEDFKGETIKKKDLQNNKIRIVYPHHSKFFKGSGFYEGEYKGEDTPHGSGVFIAAQPYWKEIRKEEGQFHGIQRYRFGFGSLKKILLLAEARLNIFMKHVQKCLGNRIRTGVIDMNFCDM